MPSPSPERTRAAVFTLVFVSGLTGLIQETTWARELSRVFGNTVQVAALLVAVFLAGLGAGAYVLGRFVDRCPRDEPAAPLGVYGRCQLAIVALSVLLAIVLPRLGGLSATLALYTQGARGWYEISAAGYAARVLVAVALLGPSAFLMGAAPAILARVVVQRDTGTGEAVERIGFLGGAAALGAAVGVFFTDVVLVPRVGIFVSQLVAAALSACAGIVAFVLVSRAGSAAEALPELAEESTDAALPVVGLTASALFIAGFAAMGLEVVWARYLGGMLGQLRVASSLLITVVLAGIAVGAGAAGYLHRRVGRPVMLFNATVALFVVTGLLLLGSVDHRTLYFSHLDAMKSVWPTAAPVGRSVLELWTSLRPALLLAGVPSVLTGASFTLANANVYRADGAVGGRVGILCLAIALGAALGGTLVALLLLPELGMQITTLVLGAVAATSMLPLHFSERPSGNEAKTALMGLALAVGGAAAGIFIFLFQPPGRLVRGSLPVWDEGGTRKTVAVSEGVNETLAVLDVPGAHKQLFANAHLISSTHPKAQRFGRAAAHVPLLQMEAPLRVLVVGFGVGNTLHAASLHPTVAHLEVVEPSRNVLAHAWHFAKSNGNVLQNGRVDVFVDDGRSYLEAQPKDTYDLVTLESSKVTATGVSSLYAREFYAMARSRLRPGGYMTQALPAYSVQGDEVRSMVRAFLDAFPQAVLLSGDDDELFLMGTRGPEIKMDSVAVGRRMRASPELLADLEGVELGTELEVAGTFAASSATLTAASANAAPITDDRPALEYSPLASLGERRTPRELFDVTGVDDWCTGCRAKIPHLDAYLRVRAAMYASDRFLVHGAGPQAAMELPSGPDVQAAIAASPYLTTLLSGPAIAARRAGARHLAEGRYEEAAGALRRAVVVDPSDALAQELLGEALTATGDFNGAAFAFDRSLKIDPKNAATHFAFARALKKLGELGGAIEQATIGVELDPTDTDGRFELGILLQNAGKRDEAEAELAAILDFQPMHPRANLVLCKREATALHFQKAIERCDVAAEGGAEIPVELVERLRPHRASAVR